MGFHRNDREYSRYLKGNPGDIAAHHKTYTMSTQISKKKALEYINHYRSGLPAGSIKSGWLNRDIIDAIVILLSTHQLTGIRVYLAKYTADDPENNIVKDTDTFILVPTQNGIAGNMDIDTAYYDYTRICPPVCDGDEGD